MKVSAHNYGKQRVRVLKVFRSAPRHEVKELDCGVRLSGDFDASFTAGDNSMVVATDTMKNTVHALAHEHLGLETERFAVFLAEHFVRKYAQVQRVVIETGERSWNRMSVGGAPHDHAFQAGSARPISRVELVRGAAPVIVSGIDQLLILKSTGSAFAGYPRCEYTTLPETQDRILATSVKATWRWSAAPADFNAANAAALDAMLRVFAVNFSPSVQTTMQEMAAAAFAAVPEIAEITLALPNKHYLPANLKPFGLDGTGVSFVPTDEPHGQIEATFSRG